MMKTTLRILLLLCVAISLAHADEWSKTYTLNGRPDLKVESSDAEIHVDTWDKNTIEARVTTERYKIGEGGIKINERQTGDQVEIEVRFPREVHFFNFNTYRAQIDIHMPREGKVNLSTGDGRVRVAGLKGDLDLRSGDGSLELDAVSGILRARTGDGNIRATGRFDLLDLNTNDGRIEVEAQRGSTMGNGWDLRTGDGSVALRIPAELAADVDIHTGDGHIDLEIPVTVDGKLGGNNVRGKINGGGSLLAIKTGDGSIRLEKL
jgi:DUF4097 and DUF4098 domain-containing protein YvlB